MRRRPPISTRTYPLFPYTTRFRAGAAAGVDHPARRPRLLRAVALEGDPVRVVALAQLDRAHGGGVAEIDAERECTLAEEVLEAAAVDLPRRRRQELAHAQLGAAEIGRAHV